MQNPPAKPNRPRFSKRTLALLIVLGAGVWGVAYQARPGPPFRFLEGMSLSNPPDTETYENKTIYYYVGRQDYRDLYNRAKAELGRNGWEETWAGDNGGGHWKVLFINDSPKDYAGSYSVCLIQDMRLGKGLPHSLDNGWNTVYAVLEKKSETKWDTLWARVREGLHL